MCLFPKKVSRRFQILKGMPPFIPCGKCIECVSAKSREWSFRIMQEASCYKFNCVITLTYEDNPIYLQPKDLSDFIKRLRARLYPHKIRYFACGEYGSLGRPHYHIIIFNYIPDDLELFFTKGSKHFKSDFISELWNKGFILVGELDLNSAKYCAKYLQKFDERSHAVAPFVRMSKNPGIGLFAFDPVTALKCDRQYVGGLSFRTPRYYIKVLERDGYDLTELKIKRRLNSFLFSPSEEELSSKRKRLNQLFKKLTVGDVKIFRQFGFDSQEYFDNPDLLRQFIIENFIENS